MKYLVVGLIALCGCGSFKVAYSIEYTQWATSMSVRGNVTDAGVQLPIMETLP